MIFSINDELPRSADTHRRGRGNCDIGHPRAAGSLKG
jgi:hypothetical protein